MTDVRKTSLEFEHSSDILKVCEENSMAVRASSPSAPKAEAGGSTWDGNEFQGYRETLSSKTKTNLVL